MQKIGLLVFVLVFMCCAETAQAQTSHTRLLVHGSKQVHESGVGLAGWVIAQSVTDAPDQWLVLAGPQYDAGKWDIEFMGGAIVRQGGATALVDTRLELTPDLFGIPLYAWANVEWIGTGGAGTIYSYLQADYVLPKGLALIGMETENVINNDKNNLSVGPHLVIPMGKLALITAYQFHSSGGDQFWTRLILNF